MMGLAYGHRAFGPGLMGFGGIGALFGFLLFAGFVAIVILLLMSAAGRHRTAPTAPAQSSDPAIQIARERLARGEIDADQYTRIVASLTGAAMPPTPA
ncbi:MAG: SHOCT domain-containing protein [Coriobacteriia bacterium]|nr:SHOCT domain-containing protein [Coriobacteriia bacterium]